MKENKSILPEEIQSELEAFLEDMFRSCTDRTKDNLLMNVGWLSDVTLEITDEIIMKNIKPEEIELFEPLKYDIQHEVRKRIIHHLKK